jgi:hypothetical protein
MVLLFFMISQLPTGMESMGIRVYELKSKTLIATLPDILADSKRDWTCCDDNLVKTLKRPNVNSYWWGPYQDVWYHYQYQERYYNDGLPRFTTSNTTNFGYILIFNKTQGLLIFDSCFFEKIDNLLEEYAT